MLVPTTKAVSGAGIFLKNKMVLLKKGHKNRMISEGIETYSASIFALFIVSDKLIITSFLNQLRIFIWYKVIFYLNIYQRYLILN